MRWPSTQSRAGRQFERVGFLILIHRSQRLKVGRQAWWPGLLSVELVFQLSLSYFQLR